MGMFRKQGARKPLTVGRIGIGYGMNRDINDGAYGITFSADGHDDKLYSLHVTNAELDRAILARQSFGETHEVNFTDAALETSKAELAKDEANGVIGHGQAMKALEMAYTMLRSFVPATEQDGNATLAYIAAVARY